MTWKNKNTAIAFSNQQNKNMKNIKQQETINELYHRLQSVAKQEGLVHVLIYLALQTSSKTNKIRSVIKQAREAGEIPKDVSAGASSIANLRETITNQLKNNE